jgi:hypothetical protein
MARDRRNVCVFITAGPSTKLFTWGGGGYGRTCATRDDEPRPAWTRLDMCYERRRAEAWNVGTLLHPGYPKLRPAGVEPRVEALLPPTRDDEPRPVWTSLPITH